MTAPHQYSLTNFGGALYTWLDAAKQRGPQQLLGRVTLDEARLVAPKTRERQLTPA